MPSTLIHLAAHWDANEGELHKWIYGRLKRLPAICLRSVNNSINVLSPETRVRLLQESIELMDDFRLPDRAARSFRDLLRLRAEAEQTKLQDLAAKRQ